MEAEIDRRVVMLLEKRKTRDCGRPLYYQWKRKMAPTVSVVPTADKKLEIRSFR